MSNNNNEDSQENQEGNGLLELAVGSLLIFLCLFLFVRIRIASPWFLLALFILAGFGIYLVLSYKKKKAQKEFEKTTVGSIERKLRSCQDHLTRNKKQIGEISKSIDELNGRLANSKDINLTTRSETEKLIAAFRQEAALRKAKIQFYESCQAKLLTMKDNQAMVEELAKKQKKLKELQEGHYEELADMEEFKYTLAHDSSYLETIEELSLKMLESRSVDSARELQLELNEMTKELKKL